VAFERVADGIDGQRAQVQRLAARHDRRQQVIGGIGGEDQDGVGRRLLERFEQRVGRGGVGLVKAQQDRDAVAGLVGAQRQRLLQVAHLVDLQRAAFPVGFHPRHVRMPVFGDQRAGPALSAGRRVAGAVERHRQRAGQRGLADLARPGDQQGVTHPAMPDGAIEVLDRPFVPDHRPVLRVCRGHTVP